MFARRIEEASLNAWPAIQQMLLDGWLLRFAGGYTKRANSVNPLYASRLDAEEKIRMCERVYRSRGLTTIFRLTPFSHPLGLDRMLEGKGYQYADCTLVMYLDLTRAALGTTSVGCLRYASSIDGWLKTLCDLKQEPLSNHGAHRSILDAISGERFLASLAVAGQNVACGLGVLEGDYVGLFDLLTGQIFRNKGYGTALVSALLERARETGARHAYLQVMRTNTPARHLYDRLGFRELYSYWYRIQSQQEHIEA